MAKRFVDRLPNEDVLAEMLNVSRTTIRGALHSLEQDGLITRRRSIGTTINHHVRPSALTLNRLVGFTDLLTEKGYKVEVQADVARDENLPPDLLAAFADEIPNAPCFVTETRFYADGHLTICVRDAAPWSKVKNQDKLPDQSDLKSFDFTRPYMTRPVDHAVVEILAAVNRGNTTVLPVVAGDAFTRLLERHYSIDGELMAVSLVDVDNHYVTFEVVRRR